MDVSATSDPVQCEFCPKVFISAEFLASHKLKKHSSIQRLDATSSSSHSNSLRVKVEDDCSPDLETFTQKDSIAEIFECDKCLSIFHGSCALKNHIQASHMAQSPPLHSDTLSMKEEADCPEIKTAKKENSDAEHFECSICDLKFSTVAFLELHKVKKHCNVRVAITTSSLNELAFSQSGNFKDQLRYPSTYQCRVCEITFFSFNELKRHMRLHPGEKPFECSVCKATFTESGNLKKHMRLHTGEKPYECSVCKATFTQLGSLKRHMHSHTGEKLYECGVCKATFAKSNCMKRHMRSHTGEKPYECGVCKATFTHSSHLKTHMHYECSVCKATSSDSRTLKNHMHLHPGEKPY